MFSPASINREPKFGQGRRTDLEVSASGDFSAEVIAEFLGENWSQQRVRRAVAASSEWEHDFGIEAATIRCVLVAAKAGEIELPPIGERGPRSTEKLPAGGEFSYTAKSIANYLRGNWSEQRVQRCLQVLDKMGDEATETFSTTSPMRLPGAVSWEAGRGRHRLGAFFVVRCPACWEREFGSSP